MPARIACPSCKAVNTISDELRGRKARCVQCKKAFAIPEAAEKDKRAEKDAIQASGKAKGARVRESDDSESDVDERPAKRIKKEPAKGSGGMVLAIGGVAVGLLFCIAGIGGIGGYFMFRSGPEKIAQADDKSRDDKKLDDKKTEAKTDPEKKEEKKKEEKKELPIDPDAGKALPAQMPSEMVAKVKKATVYLHVTMPSGVTAEGSGFFAMEKGIVITNAHVLGMMQETSRAPQRVDVVLDSGLDTETKMTGEVLGVDRFSDLAVVRVPDSAKLPAPLTLSTDAPTELQKIYIFGFPFGEKLGKNITISEQAITSLRPDKAGGLKEIQVNGGMNPGNSGGPVVNTRGNLVGVSVSIISGAQISFAVPAEKVLRAMEGRIASHEHGEPFNRDGQTHLPVRVKCLDPLNKVQDLRVEIWTGPPGAPRPTSDQKPKAVAGDGPRKEHVVKYTQGSGAIDLPLPTLPGGHVYWVQPVLTSGKGTHWGSAQSTSTDFAVLERKAANLTVSLENQKERLAKIDSRLIITETLGKKEKKEVIQTTVDAIEFLQTPIGKGKKTVNIRTTLSKVNVRVSSDGKDLKFSPDEMEALFVAKSMSPIFVVDETNATASYASASIPPGHPKYFLKDLIELFNGFVNNPFEATQFKMPNRVIQPQESFASASTMMTRVGSGPPAPPKGKGFPGPVVPTPPTINDLKITCTLEGVRVRRGREEAVLSVVGSVESRKVKGKTLGNITGKIGFDITGGFVSSAKIKIYAESEETVPGVGTYRDSVSQEIDLEREPRTVKKAGVSANMPRDRFALLEPTPIRLHDFATRIPLREFDLGR